jgi:hypothetical protein
MPPRLRAVLAHRINDAKGRVEYKLDLFDGKNSHILWVTRDDCVACGHAGLVDQYDAQHEVGDLDSDIIVEAEVEGICGQRHRKGDGAIECRVHFEDCDDDDDEVRWSTCPVMFVLTHWSTVVYCGGTGRG